MEIIFMATSLCFASRGSALAITSSMTLRQLCLDSLQVTPLTGIADGNTAVFSLAEEDFSRTPQLMFLCARVRSALPNSCSSRTA